MRKFTWIMAAASALAIGLSSPSLAQSEGDDAQQPPTLGLNHIGLTVSDLEASAALFTDVLGFRRAGGDPDYPSIFVFNGELFVTLWQTKTDDPVAFDRRTNVGLHHMAITVRDLTVLDALHQTLLDYPGVMVEFAPEFLGEGPTTHMMIRGPSGLRLEFIVPANRMSEEERARPNPRDARQAGG